MVARLNSEIRKVLALPEISAKIIELGGEIRTGSADEFAGWMTKAIAEWGDVVKAVMMMGEPVDEGRATSGLDLMSSAVTPRMARRINAMNLPDLAFAVFLIALGGLAFELAGELGGRHRRFNGAGLCAARARPHDRAAYGAVMGIRAALGGRSRVPGDRAAPAAVDRAAVALFALLLPVDRARR